MSFYEKVKGLDQKFSWSFSGVLLAIFSLIVTLWIAFEYEKHPRLVIQMISDSPVYDIKEEVNKLDILFEGEDIRKKNQTLSILTLRIINLGKASILKNSFDDKALPVLAINDSRVIKVDLVDASNDYLRDTAKLIASGDNRFSISPVIMDPDEYFLVKLLLIHDKTKQPKLDASGKVSGSKPIEILSHIAINPEHSFMRTVVGGNALIQLTRAPVYFVGTVVFIAFFVALPSSVAGKIQISRRRARVSRFLEASGQVLTASEGALFEEYIKRGELFFLTVNKLLSDPERLSATVKDLETGSRPDDEAEGAHLIYASETPHFWHNERNVARFLLKNGLVTVENETVLVDKGTASKVKLFIFFLSALVPGKVKASATTK